MSRKTWLFVLFGLFLSYGVSQGQDLVGGDVEVDKQLTEFWTWAKLVLLLLFVTFFVISFLKVFNTIRSSDDHGKTATSSIKGWFIGTGFLLIAFSAISFIKSDSSKLFSVLEFLPPEWMWLENVVIVAFMLVFFISIVITYSRLDPDDPSATFDALKRIGLAFILILILLAIIGQMGSFIQNPNIDKGLESTNTENNLTAFMERAVAKSKITQGFFYTISFIAAILFIFSIIQRYNEFVNQGKQFNWYEWAKPIFILILLSMWPKIFELLDGSFSILENRLIANINEGDEDKLSSYFNNLLQMSMSFGTSSAQNSLTSTTSYAVGMSAVYLNWFLDAIISIYIGINKMLLGVVSPLALVLTFSKATDSALSQWLKMFVKFYFLDLIVIMINVVGIHFIDEWRSNSTISEFLGTFQDGYVNPEEFARSTLGAWYFLILKIVFLMAGNGVITSLLQAKDTGVGSSIGGVLRLTKKTIPL